jgi:NADH-quinone oxidoreductase subunit A
MATPTGIVAYLLLFAGTAVIFLLLNLVVGYFLRPSSPNEEKLEIYECGEPTIGSSFVQFDLRFYVVALLFIIFDVEVAFFYPWATVFGKANHLQAVAQTAAETSDPDTLAQLGAIATTKVTELGIAPAGESFEALAAASSKMMWTSLADIGVFFAVLMVGFAYVWKRGDLDWVRSTISTRAADPGAGSTIQDAA